MSESCSEVDEIAAQGPASVCTSELLLSSTTPWGELELSWVPIVDVV